MGAIVPMNLNNVIPAVATVAGCWFGYSVCSEPISQHCIVDTTGRTSIVVEYDNGDWCELRGPARYIVLAEWEAFPGWPSDRDKPDYPIHSWAAGSNDNTGQSETVLHNPHYSPNP